MVWKSMYYKKHGFSPENRTKHDSVTKLLRFSIKRSKTTIPPYLQLQLKLFVGKYDEYYLKPYYIRKISKNAYAIYKKGKLFSILYIDFNMHEIVQMPEINPF